MPWLRAGTVAVTNGSTTVTGTNADFAANARTGDSFVGPDGLNYEVANVASATVISILPAYKGPTASGAAYAIMPVQGYDKMLSDAFNNLNNQFGPKLAALGTTGNYDKLPVSKGGTGGDTPAAGRAGLQLGSAAVLVAQTSPLDVTANAAMVVGAGGLLSTTQNFETGSAGWIGNRFRGWNGALATDGPPISVASYGIELGYSTNRKFAAAIGIDGDLWVAGGTAAGFQASWNKKARAGANSDITSLTGLTTALSIAQGGTGAKTVAAAVTALGLDVATITNANGTAIRFPDGTQICTGYVNAPSLAIVDVRGSCFAGPYLAPPMFASAFIQPPVATMSIVGNTGLIWVTGAVAPTTTYFQGAYAMSPYSVTASAYISYMAVGRWK